MYRFPLEMRMIRTVSRSLILVLALALPAGAQEMSDPLADADVLTREALVQAVRDRNPNLEAARHAWRAARARVPQVRALPNPEASYGVAPLSIGSDDVPFGHEIEVRQGLPWRGKRQARATEAQAEAEAALYGYRETLLELATEASRMFDEYYLADRALDINAQYQRLLREYQEVAAGRYAAGLAPQTAPLQAEVELAKLVQSEAELRAERRALTARLNSLLHRPAGLPLPPPPERLPEPIPVPEGSDELLRAAMAARPEVAEADAMIRAREAGATMAALERKPDFEVMTTYSSMWPEVEHRWMAGVAVDLPLWKRRLDAAEAEARLAQARKERESLETDVSAEVEAALARYHEALHHLEIQRDRLLPASRDQIQAARASFEAGQGGFLDVIDAERDLREAELMEHRMLAEAHQRRAALERALGRLPAGMIFDSEDDGDSP
ncbi:TolC family protein [bacterium]|nr:MAG: TolC family protein [bacterium]